MQQLFIIVPYRDRAQHLAMFIPHYSSILPEAKIVIVEQNNKQPFNRGWLLNCGFDFVSKHYKSTKNYFAFHDVDILYINQDAAKVYGYTEQPTHIATACSQFNYTMPYPDYCGGVILLNEADFIKANGFSNSYHGWGAEDDDFRNRLTKAGLEVKHIPNCIFQSLPHKRTLNNHLYRQNVVKLKAGTSDGLHNIQYKSIVTEMPNYTILKVS